MFRNFCYKFLNNKRTGYLGELIVFFYLKLNGYLILDKNFKGKYGEIDLIAFKDKKLIIIEVKTRRIFNKIYPATYSINLKKQENIVKCTKEYLKKESINLRKLKIKKIENDAICVYLVNNGNFLPKIIWYKSYFL